MADPLRHHARLADLHGAFGSDQFGVQAERFARFFGTPKFILSQTAVVACWITFNVVGVARHWDVYPFILLNLLFSTQAAYAAPLILLAQTRQADRDKAAIVADARHRQELADAQSAQLAENTDLTRRIHEVQGRQMAILSGLEHVNAELNLIRQAVAPSAPNPEAGTDDG